MLSQFTDLDEHELVTDHRHCAFHEIYPEQPFPGCTCSSVTRYVPRSPEEVAAIKAKKVRDEEDRILALAEMIKARRAMEAEAA